MPRQIGLGYSIQDDDIDGDIDFDFFEGNGEQREKEERIKTPDVVDETGKSSDKDNGGHAGIDDNKRQWSNSNDEWGNNEAKSTTDKPKHVNGWTDEEEEVSRSSDNVDTKKIFAEANSKVTSDERNDEEVRETSDQLLEDNDTFESDTESENSLDVTVTDSSSSSSFYEDDSFESLSESEITDVTPLSSSNVSPLPASPIRYKFAKKTLQKNEKFLEMKAKSKVPTSGGNNHFSKCNPSGKSASSVDLDMLVEAILKLERDRKNGSQLSLSTTERASSSTSKKNMSFTDDQVRKIDRENKILLQRILDQRGLPQTSPGTSLMQKQSSSSINRLRQQKRIEAENMALLKRIQSARPTKELSRHYLLKTPADNRIRTSSLNSRSWSGSPSVLKSSTSIDSIKVETPMNKMSAMARSKSAVPIPIIGNGRTRVRSNRATEVRTEWNSSRRKLKS